MGLDLYVWLAYRLHVLQKPTTIRWARLHSNLARASKASGSSSRPLF